MEGRKYTPQSYKTFIASLGILLTIWLLPQSAEAASLFLNPPEGTYVAGSTFSVDVLIDTESVNINAVSGVLAFDPKYLRARSISKGDSIIDLWLLEPAIAQEGEVVFEGLMVNPGFTGIGKVITIHFTVLEAGTTDARLEEGVVLKNDGFGSNVVTTLGTTNIHITSPGNLEPTTEPLPTQDLSHASTTDPNLLAPVILNYTDEISQLSEFTVRGVTYPHVPVYVYLQEKGDEEVKRYSTMSDSGGNFVYKHSVGLYELLKTESLSAVLSALAWSAQQEYSFWLTAVNANIETEPTRSFDIVIIAASGWIVSTIILALLLAAVVIIGGMLFFRMKNNNTMNVYRPPL